jgi:O-acetyl-ADP-ribose deacetylase (regulator of RNase III)
MPTGKSYVTQIEGNLLEFPKEIECIMHGCNTNNNMTRGFALSVATRFPHAFYADNTAWRRSNIMRTPLMGQFSHANVSPTKHVINLYHGHPFRITAFCSALSRALKFCRETGVVKIGLPYAIGCGLEGGSWMEVRRAITRIVDTVPGMIVFVVKIPD